MKKATEIISKKIEAVEDCIGQYKDGLITGAEALFHISGIANDPVVPIIFKHDADYMKLCDKTMADIRALEEDKG